MPRVEDLGRKTIFSINPYVPGKPIEEVEREFGISDALKMASNENPLGPSPKAIAALREAAVRVNIYPDGYCFYLKRDLAAELKCKEEQLIIGNGSDEILKLIAEAFLDPGDEVIYAQPTFSEYEFVSRVMDALPVPVAVSQDLAHDLKAMAARISPRTKIVFICNPNNPTGTMITGDELELFLKAIPDRVLVVIDEAYREYVTDPHYPDSMGLLRQDDRLIILRTFAKIYGLAGLRIGYGISSPEIIAMINRVKEPFNVNYLAQVAARASLRDADHLQRSRELVIEGRGFLYEAFERLGLPYIPTQANFIFVNIGKDSRDVFTRLLREGVIVRTGDIFGYPEFIRVTIGTPEQNQLFLEKLQKVLASFA